jgi:divalent metal cation (Fe/Co/Zn/Cd) transporter
VSARAQAVTAVATLVVAAGAWLVWENAARLALGPVLGDLRLLVAAVAVLVFLAVADAGLLRLARRRHPP